MKAEIREGSFTGRRFGVAAGLAAAAALVVCLGTSGCAQTLGEASSSSSDATSSSQAITADVKAQGLSASSSESSETSGSEAEASGEDSSQGSEAVAASAGSSVASDEESDSTHPVCLSLSAPGYRSGDGKIPVTVNGTSKKGAFVDLVCYIGADGSGIELSPGSYTVTVIESPLMSGGRFYNIPTSSLDVNVPEGLGEGESMSVSKQLVFSKRKAKGLSEDVIDTAYQYAVSGGLDEAAAKQYKADLMAAAGI